MALNKQFPFDCELKKKEKEIFNVICVYKLCTCTTSFAQIFALTSIFYVAKINVQTIFLHKIRKVCPRKNDIGYLLKILL